MKLLAKYFFDLADKFGFKQDAKKRSCRVEVIRLLFVRVFFSFYAHRLYNGIKLCTTFCQPYNRDYNLMDILQFFLGLLKDPLATLQDLLVHFNTFTYIILDLIIFVETGLIVMPLLPGDSLLFAAGLLASSTGKLDIQVMIPTLIAAALLGDNVNYFVGKYFSGFIKSREQTLFFKREYITKTEAFYERHGGKSVILARFVPIIRTIAPFVAGAGSMRYPKYILFCVLGAVLWVTSLTLAGYFLGSNEWVKHNFEKVVLGIVFLSVMPIIWHAIKAKLVNKPAN